MAETITVEGDNLTLDLLLVRFFGLVGQSLVVETLSLNPGLSDAGVVLPIGKRIILPDKPETPTATETVEVVTLFG